MEKQNLIQSASKGCTSTTYTGRDPGSQCSNDKNSCLLQAKHYILPNLPGQFKHQHDELEYIFFKLFIKLALIFPFITYFKMGRYYYKTD